MSMDSDGKQKLDDYLTGVHSRDELGGVLHRCTHCNKEVSFAMYTELGGAFYCNTEDEDNSYCCGDEMEVVID